MEFVEGVENGQEVSGIAMCGYREEVVKGWRKEGG